MPPPPYFYKTGGQFVGWTIWGIDNPGLDNPGGGHSWVDKLWVDKTTMNPNSSWARALAGSGAWAVGEGGRGGRPLGAR